MKYIELTQGKKAIVDDEDFECLNKFKWRYLNGYAVRTVTISKGVRKPEWMHRVINKTPKEFLTDHINHNKLDNRKKNLRAVSASLNLLNRGVRKDNKSGYTGVYWHKQHKKWYVQINFLGEHIFVGLFNSKQQAIMAHSKAIDQYYENLSI